MSSIITSQPYLFFNKSLIRYWKISGVDVIPNASRLKQNLPNGVINVVNLAISGCRGICQSPLDVSSFEKYRVPASLGAISSKVGRTNLESFTALFNLLRSTQILSLPLLFCTNTMGTQHSVGSVIFRLYQFLPSAWAPLPFLALKEKLFFLLFWCNMVGPFPTVGSSLAHTWTSLYLQTTQHPEVGKLIMALPSSKASGYDKVPVSVTKDYLEHTLPTITGLSTTHLPIRFFACLEKRWNGPSS